MFGFMLTPFFDKSRVSFLAPGNTFLNLTLCAADGRYTWKLCRYNLESALLHPSFRPRLQFGSSMDSFPD